MPIPDYQTVMLPLLKFSGDRREHSLREAINTLSNHFNLTEKERQALLPNGQQPIFHNRVAWAQAYLKKASLLRSTRQGYFGITRRGFEVLKQNPEKIDVKFLDQFKEFREFRDLGREKTVEPATVAAKAERMPEEVLETACQSLRKKLAQELLRHIKENSLNMFEKIVLELLAKMGYAGGQKDAIKAIDKTEGARVDFIIKQDPLGLEIICIRAERLGNVIGRPEMRQFVGALQEQRAKKGIFITTSDFSPDAHEYTLRIDRQIALVPGDLLAQYMIDYDIGVSPLATYKTKKIDSDYFTMK